jgi:antirestriction protein ArdC
LPIARIARADRFFAATGADIRHGGTRAYYAEGADYVQMPPFETFRDAESYAATLAHEVMHWTKHETRLARDFGRVRHGDEGYAKEELVAELGSAFLGADLELTPEVREDHAAYIASWLKALRDDKRLIFNAAAHAQRAVDYLHGLQPQAAIDAGSPLAEERAA